MELDLSPKLAKEVVGSDGGSYLAWSPSELPMLSHGKIGAGKLRLVKNGFTFPHYADSPKIIYVLQGNGVAGIIHPDANEEKVIAIKEGDVIAAPLGMVSWWYNKEDTELIIVFLGDTSKANKPGEFTFFYLAGGNGITNGFSTEFLSHAWDVEEKITKSLVQNQKGVVIIKLEDNFKMPEPKKEHRKGIVLNYVEASPDVDVKNGGRVVFLSSKNLALLGEVGFGAYLVRLDGNAMCSPGFSSDSALQVIYIVKGSGRLQVVGVDGRRVLDTTVSAGSLFIVPRFFVVSEIASPEGMEWFSIVTTPSPIFTQLAGKTSVLKALSPQVLEASFNVAPDVVQKFLSKRTCDAILLPPPN